MSPHDPSSVFLTDKKLAVASIDGEEDKSDSLRPTKDLTPAVTRALYRCLAESRYAPPAVAPPDARAGWAALNPKTAAAAVIVERKDFRSNSVVSSAFFSIINVVVVVVVALVVACTLWVGIENP